MAIHTDPFRQSGQHVTPHHLSFFINQFSGMEKKCQGVAKALMIGRLAFLGHKWRGLSTRVLVDHTCSCTHTHAKFDVKEVSDA